MGALVVLLALSGCSTPAHTALELAPLEPAAESASPPVQQAPPIEQGQVETEEVDSFWGAIVGSFSTDSPDALEAAAKTQDRLAAAGFPTFWGISDWFSTLKPGFVVVYTGPFDTPEDAKVVAQHLSEAGFNGAYPREFIPGSELAHSGEGVTAQGLLMGDDGAPYPFLTGEEIELNRGSGGTVFGWIGSTYFNLYQGVGGSTYGWVGDEWVSLYQGVGDSTYGWVGDDSVQLYSGVGGSTYGWSGDDYVNLYEGAGGSTYGWSGDDYVNLYEGVGGSTYGWIGDEYVYSSPNY